MKTIIKVTAVVLLFILMSNIVCFGIENTSVEMTVLGESGLNIMNQSSTGYITRAAMVDILINFLPIQNDNVFNIKRRSRFNSDKIIEYQPFSDWQLDGEKEEIIKKLVLTEIIKGDGDGNFRPDEYCTYAEMVTFIVRALGWSVLEEENGGFPSGCINVAKDIGIISDALEESEIEIYDETARIIFKSLFVNTLERVPETAYDQFGGYPHYEYSSCVLENYHNLLFEYGYALKSEEGITIEDKDFLGEVYDNPTFKDGYVLCIYNFNIMTGENNILICVESEDNLPGRMSV